ncbi:hypothetical protein [Candidatus Lokiarchaeum ossiferum]
MRSKKLRVKEFILRHLGLVFAGIIIVGLSLVVIALLYAIPILYYVSVCGTLGSGYGYSVLDKRERDKKKLVDFKQILQSMGRIEITEMAKLLQVAESYLQEKLLLWMKEIPFLIESSNPKRAIHGVFFLESFFALYEMWKQLPLKEQKPPMVYREILIDQIKQLIGTDLDSFGAKMNLYLDSI